MYGQEPVMRYGREVFVYGNELPTPAIDPYNGRSALDAVELMNVGANYLREHVTPDVRIHYVITNGGEVPNVVPKERPGLVYHTCPKQRKCSDFKGEDTESGVGSVDYDRNHF